MNTNVANAGLANKSAKADVLPEPKPRCLANLKFIPKRIQDELWWLVISAEYDYSRIVIADYEIDNEKLVLWLEDKQDYKNTLDECLQLDVPLRKFADVIRAENLNSYEGTKMHPTKSFTYKARIVVNEPIAWYRDDAGYTEQGWAREAMLKAILTALIEQGVRTDF